MTYSIESCLDRVPVPQPLEQVDGAPDIRLGLLQSLLLLLRLITSATDPINPGRLDSLKWKRAGIELYRGSLWLKRSGCTSEHRSDKVRSVRLSALLRATAATLGCFAVLTGCSGEPERPPLAEAARRLVNDGDALSSGIEAGLTGLTKERASDPDRDSTCLDDEEQRFYIAKGSFANPSAESATNFVGLLKGKLISMGYSTEVVDNLDLWEDNVSVAVLVHPEAKLTFVLLARMDATPNVVIVGKTECYPRNA
ncbi:hypothetical protein GBF35_45865 [Nonomuraea phyllanthi]|uniref:hypothetical protein n=1 Tax=Nonomuraea phyllanthi TaxID=2219224 RepID=UPI001293D4DD|nr:hypothetical protein [Nonomuraea phyllanthi]QFY12917.1 hypothetical protein GBF35_45865 [Nonomuraea phyllanthi]